MEIFYVLSLIRFFEIGDDLLEPGGILDFLAALQKAQLAFFCHLHFDRDPLPANVADRAERFAFFLHGFIVARQSGKKCGDPSI